MNLAKVLLLSTIGTVLALAPAHACNYGMKSRVSAEAPATPIPAPIAQAPTDAMQATTATPGSSVEDSRDVPPAQVTQADAASPATSRPN